MAEHRLKNQAIAFIQLKGGVGKTLLSVNLAAISALQNNWTTVLVDMDANAPLTGAVFGSYTASGTVTTALERVSHHEQINDHSLSHPVRALSQAPVSTGALFRG